MFNRCPRLLSPWRTAIAKVRVLLASAKQMLLLTYEVQTDTLRYFRSAAMGRLDSSQPAFNKHLEGLIIRYYHSLEKGLTTPASEFRSGFGAQIVKELTTLVADESVANRDIDPNQLDAARKTLKAYAAAHIRVGGATANKELPDLQSHIMPRAAVSKPVVSVAPSDKEALERVMLSRSSIREFRTDCVPSAEDIESVVNVARWTPSVCNRQSWKVHYFTGTKVQELLAHQAGNRGFGHRTPVLLAITCDLRLFVGVIERNQAWIDGGMFSMSLLLALHAHGIGAVPLNWAVTNTRDRALRKVGSFPDFERIIMLVGCGFPHTDAMATRSQRRCVSSIFVVH